MKHRFEVDRVEVISAVVPGEAGVRHLFIFELSQAHEAGGGHAAFTQKRGFIAGALQVFHGRRQLDDMTGRGQRFRSFALLFKACQRGFVGFQRFAPVLLFDQLRVIEGLQRGRNRNLGQLFIGDDALGDFVGFHFFFKEIAQESSRLAAAADGQA